jgi:hypothetical protein
MNRAAVCCLSLFLRPRGQAAEYIGVGVPKFEEMLDDGRMPKSKRINRRGRRGVRYYWDQAKADRGVFRVE